MIKTYKKGNSTKIARNFKLKEFDCKGKKCCSYTLIDDRLIDYLQQMRDYFQRAVIINSGYRCAEHNKKVGGTSKSQHKKGCAADIVVKGVEPRKVAAYAEKIGIKGIGLYDTFTHIDTRANKAFWYSHKQEKRNTFQ